jgi:hypothetical protein
MFFKTKTNKARNEMVKNVRELLQETSGCSPKEYNEHNEIWSQWSKLSTQPKDLYDLISSDVNDVYKARAAAIILSPDPKCIPFEWNGSKSNFLKEETFKNLFDAAGGNQEIKRFFLRLLLVNIETVLRHPDVCLPHVRAQYNYYIIQALESMAKTESYYCERLFANFKFRSINEENYGPLDRLLHSSAPEKYKIISDRQARVRLSNEAFNENGAWMNHYLTYSEDFEFRLGTAPFPYSVMLFAEQVKFLLQSEVLHKKLVKHDWPFSVAKLVRTLTILDGEEHHKLRQDLVEYMLLHNSDFDTENKLHVYDTDSYEAAKILLAKFENDEIIAQIVNKAIASYEAERTLQGSKTVMLEAHKIAVLEAMK